VIRVVGVDAGGTWLRLALADGEGGVLARRQGPGFVVSGEGVEEASATLAGEVAKLAVDARAALPVDALVAGLAGIGVRGHAPLRPEGTALEARLRETGLASRVRLVSDAEAALHDAFPRGPGILLVAGTGSIALARDADGALRRAGGWGRELGDEGSGYALGLETLRAAVRALEGRGPPTALEAVVKEKTGAATPGEILLWLRKGSTAGGGEKGRVAALVPGLVSAADGGDPVAAEIVAGGVEALAAHVRALAAHLGTRAADLRTRARGVESGPVGAEPMVALHGGLLALPGGLLGTRIRAVLEGEGFPLREGEVDGVRGAIRLALELVRQGASE
jgi:glucosamine kinase